MLQEMIEWSKDGSFTLAKTERVKPAFENIILASAEVQQVLGEGHSRGLIEMTLSMPISRAQQRVRERARRKIS